MYDVYVDGVYFPTATLILAWLILASDVTRACWFLDVRGCTPADVGDHWQAQRNCRGRTTIGSCEQDLPIWIFTCWSRYSLEMFLIMSNLCMSAITLICLSEEPGVDKQLCSSMDSRNWGLYHTRLGFRLSLDDICMWTYIYICVCVWFWKEQLSSSKKEHDCCAAARSHDQFAIHH